MKYSTSETINAPAAKVFEALSAVDRFEHAARARGADVQRLDGMPEPGLGACWRASFSALGKRRELAVSIVRFAPPRTLVVESKSAGMFGVLTIDVEAMAPARCRLSVQLELRPKNLSGRLLIQSVKLSKKSLSQRFKDRVARFSSEIEASGQGVET